MNFVRTRSTVSMVTGYGPITGVRFPAEQIFSRRHRVQSDTGAPSSSVAGRDANHILLSSAEAKNVWSYIPLFLHTSAWHGACSITRDNFTFNRVLRFSRR